MKSDCEACAGNRPGILCPPCAGRLTKELSPRRYTKSTPEERRRRKDLAAQAKLDRALERGITRSDTESASKTKSPLHLLPASYSRRADIRSAQYLKT